MVNKTYTLGTLILFLLIGLFAGIILGGIILMSFLISGIDNIDNIQFNMNESKIVDAVWSKFPPDVLNKINNVSNYKSTINQTQLDNFLEENNKMQNRINKDIKDGKVIIK